ncbi:CD276 antigen homolog [Glandiceps talaboti]
MDVPINTVVVVLLLLTGLPDGVTVKIKMNEEQTANVGDERVVIFCEYTEPITDSETTLVSSYVEWEMVNGNDQVIGMIVNGVVHIQADKNKYSITESTLSRKQPSLEIFNINLYDEAVYYCKVNFILNGNSGPSQEQDSQSTILTVNKPPSRVDIVGYEDQESIGLNTSGGVMLECRAYDSKPAAILTWYIGETKIMDNIRNSTVRNDDGTFTTSSILTYFPSSMDNNRTIKCACESNSVHSEVEYTDQVKINISKEKLVADGLANNICSNKLLTLIVTFLVLVYIV